MDTTQIFTLSLHDALPIFEVSEYGVDFQADQRLIVVMAALDAAGFEPLPTGREATGFRAKLRKDLANLDPDLRTRSEEHTSELQSLAYLVCRLLLEKKKEN